MDAGLPGASVITTTESVLLLSSDPNAIDVLLKELNDLSRMEARMCVLMHGMSSTSSQGP